MVNNGKKHGSWFSTIPGIITSITGIITAITSLIVAYNNLSNENNIVPQKGKRLPRDVIAVNSSTLVNDPVHSGAATPVDKTPKFDIIWGDLSKQFKISKAEIEPDYVPPPKETYSVNEDSPKDKDISSYTMTFVLESKRYLELNIEELSLVGYDLSGQKLTEPEPIFLFDFPKGSQKDVDMYITFSMVYIMHQTLRRGSQTYRRAFPSPDRDNEKLSVGDRKIAYVKLPSDISSIKTVKIFYKYYQ